MDAAAMQRLGLSVTEQQLEWLKQEADKIGISIGELLRRWIDERRLTK